MWRVLQTVLCGLVLVSWSSARPIDAGETPLASMNAAGAILLVAAGGPSGGLKYALRSAEDPGGGWDDALAAAERVVLDLPMIVGWKCPEIAFVLWAERELGIQAAIQVLIRPSPSTHS